MIAPEMKARFTVWNNERKWRCRCGATLGTVEEWGEGEERIKVVVLPLRYQINNGVWRHTDRDPQRADSAKAGKLIGQAVAAGSYTAPGMPPLPAKSVKRALERAAKKPQPLQHQHFPARVHCKACRRVCIIPSVLGIPDDKDN